MAVAMEFIIVSNVGGFSSQACFTRPFAIRATAGVVTNHSFDLSILPKVAGVLGLMGARP